MVLSSSVLALSRGDSRKVLSAFEAAQKNNRAADLQKELEELFTTQNTSQDATRIPATFLRVTIVI